MTMRVTIDWCGRPPTVNKHRRLHPMERARIDALWREAGCIAARGRESMGSVNVTVWGRYPTRTSLPDCDGIQPAAKAVLDGIVDAGVLPDDRPPFVRSITYRMPEVAKGQQPALVVELEEAP